MKCKCGAKNLNGHVAKAAAGYPAHVYTGFVWTTQGARRVSALTTDQEKP